MIENSVCVTPVSLTLHHLRPKISIQVTDGIFVFLCLWTEKPLAHGMEHQALHHEAGDLRTQSFLTIFLLSQPRVGPCGRICITTNGFALLAACKIRQRQENRCHLSFSEAFSLESGSQSLRLCCHFRCEGESKSSEKINRFWFPRSLEKKKK